MCPHRHSVSVNPFPFAENEHKTAKSPEHSWRFVCTLSPSPISPSVPPSPFPLLSLPSPRFSRYDAGGRRDQEVRRDQVASSWSHPDGGTRSHPLGPILPLNKHTVRQRTLTHPVAVHTTYAGKMRVTHVHHQLHTCPRAHAGPPSLRMATSPLTLPPHAPPYLSRHFYAPLSSSAQARLHTLNPRVYTPSINAPLPWSLTPVVGAAHVQALAVSRLCISDM
jgi:hypothetical protein